MPVYRSATSTLGKLVAFQCAPPVLSPSCSPSGAPATPLGIIDLPCIVSFQRTSSGVSPGSETTVRGRSMLSLPARARWWGVRYFGESTLSLEVWKAKFGPASGRTQAHPPMDTSTATVPLLAEVNEPNDEDVVEVLPPPPVLAPPFLIAHPSASTPMSATGDEGSLEASPLAPASGIAGGRQGAKLKGEAVKAAMEEEIRSLVGMGTWELVERPRGVNIMKNRWVLTTKYRLDDTVEHEKARLVVKGFTQVCGADYDETYSPMSSYIMLRIFLSIIAVFDLNLMELDMKNAFLQSKLDRVLYMYQPDYFDDGTGRVFKLLKSLYGLKQSPLLWYRALDGVLLGAGWKKSQVDEALYFKVGDIGVTCWVLVDVDDLLAASSSPVMLKELKQLLEDAFELREISPGYVDKLRRRFIDEEQGGRVPKTPVSVDAYAELTFDDEEAQEREEDEYRQKVGSLQFAATTTRPDIAFACSKLGSGLRVRSEVDRCLAYLADTRDTALEFGSGPESLELIGYVDANDAGDKQKRTRTSSYVFIYGGAAVSWSSSRIKCATLLSTESEYVVATNAGKEGRRLRFLLAKFKLLNAGKPTILRVDNKSAITVAEGLGLTGNLKHMERSYAWLQHIVRSGKFVLNYIPTTEQPADFLTKALHFPAFNRCSDAIGQVRLADVGDGDDDVQQ
ncbi:unnamed protein product [Closterium sp. NIES-53]